MSTEHLTAVCRWHTATCMSKISGGTNKRLRKWMLVYASLKDRVSSTSVH